MATPHFGSNIAALGWRLRSVPGLGAVPAPSLAHLSPGPHLDELNATLQVGRLGAAGHRGRRGWSVDSRAGTNEGMSEITFRGVCAAPTLTELTPSRPSRSSSHYVDPGRCCPPSTQAAHTSRSPLLHWFLPIQAMYVERGVLLPPKHPST